MLKKRGRPIKKISNLQVLSDDEEVIIQTSIKPDLHVALENDDATPQELLGDDEELVTFIQVSDSDSCVSCTSSFEYISDDSDDSFDLQETLNEEMQEALAMEMFYDGLSEDEEDEDFEDHEGDEECFYDTLDSNLFNIPMTGATFLFEPQDHPVMDSLDPTPDMKSQEQDMKQSKTLSKKDSKRVKTVETEEESIDIPPPTKRVFKTPTVKKSKESKQDCTPSSSSKLPPTPTTPSTTPLSQLIKKPFMASETVQALNSTLLLLSEIRKRDPNGSSNPSSLNARIKNAAQSAVSATSQLYKKSSTQKSVKDMEILKNFEELTSLLHSQTAALLASKNKLKSEEPMKLDDLLDTKRLSDLIHTNDISSQSEPDKWNCKIPLKNSFNKSHKKRLAHLMSKKDFKSAFKSNTRIKRMKSTTLSSSHFIISPDLKPETSCYSSSNQGSGLDSPIFHSLPPALSEFDTLEPFLL